MAPTAPLDQTDLEIWTGFFRATSPGTMVALDTMERETDVRHVLPAVHVPTLVLHRTGDQVYSVEEGRYLAEHIAGPSSWSWTAWITYRRGGTRTPSCARSTGSSDRFSMKRQTSTGCSLR